MTESVRAALSEAIPTLPVRPAPEGGMRSHPVVVEPDSTDAVAELLALAGTRGWTVLPIGAGGCLAALQESPDIVLGMGRFGEIARYQPADLTATLGAGVTLGDLRETTTPERQWLPLDPSGWNEASLGAVLAQGGAGPLETGFGRPRDYLLGAHIVTGDGRVLSLGGEVVKNVAGFDLLKLLVGSRGTLGVFTTVTVRLFPTPSRDRTWLFEADSPERAAEVARAVATAPLDLAALEWVRGPSRSGVRDRIVVRALGRPGPVDRVVEELGRSVAGGRVLSDPEAQALWSSLEQEDLGAAVLLEITSRASETDAVMEAVGSFEAEASGGASVQVACRVRMGRTRLKVTPGEGSDDGVLLDRLTALRSACRSIGARWEVVRAPAAIGESLRAEPPPSRVREILEGVRASFDPHGVFPKELRPW